MKRLLLIVVTLALALGFTSAVQVPANAVDCSSSWCSLSATYWSGKIDVCRKDADNVPRGHGIVTNDGSQYSDPLDMRFRIGFFYGATERQVPGKPGVYYGGWYAANWQQTPINPGESFGGYYTSIYTWNNDPVGCKITHVQYQTN